MSNQRRYGEVVSERLAAWYLFKPRTFQISLEQLAELMDALEEPVRLGSSWHPSEKRKKVDELIEYLNKIVAMKKKGLIAEPPPEEEKEVGNA